MRAVDIEIPLQSEKTWVYKLLEKLPATLTYLLLSAPILLSFIDPWLTIFFIVAYFLTWFLRAIGLNIRVLQGYSRMKKHMVVPWEKLLEDLEKREINLQTPKWHAQNLKRLERQPAAVKPREVVHAIIVAIYNEPRDVLEPTIQAIVNSNYDLKKVMLIIAYEGRDGAQAEATSKDLIEQYGSRFMWAKAIEHPLLADEVTRGKGGNINYAAKALKLELEARKIDPIRVIVTTLDCDHRPHANYLGALTYTYCLVPEPRYISFQPIPILTNNIWDAPAPMRVIAVGNSFWMIIQALRPHMLRNFASHAQSMQTLIDTNFWSGRTIVEDGHQYWRTYLRYDGRHEVYPILVPIYQDAVLASTYRRTFRAQFLQLRRWAWGASDVPFVIAKGFLTKNKIPKGALLVKLLRLIEGHVSWAAAPLILSFSAFIPILLIPDDVAANQLPSIASTIQRLAIVGLIITLFLSFKVLPPKPARYKRRRNLLMITQWALLPITTIVYSSFAALTSQTRLFFGWYLDSFDVTEKAVKK